MIKGFTLIELLAVIIILGIIMSITFLSVSKVLQNSKDSLSSSQKHNIEEAAEVYYLKEGMSENSICVSIDTLINKGYIDSNEVIDPKTKEIMTGSVKIIYSANQYSYEYSSNKCS